MPNTRLLPLFPALAALTLGSGAQAQDWSFTVAPYLWAAGQSGSVGLLPGVPPSEVDLSFGDIFENVDGSFMILGSARRGRFAISADFQYIATTEEGDTPGPLYGATRVETQTILATLTADYQLASSAEGEIWGGAGLRYWDVENSLSLAAGTLPARSVSGSDAWIDPVLGLRGSYKMGPRVTLVGWAYLGGFGVGSELMSDVFAGLDYGFSDLTSVTLGWRHLTVDRTDGDFVYDVSQSGPILGLTFRF